LFAKETIQYEGIHVYSVSKLFPKKRLGLGREKALFSRFTDVHVYTLVSRSLFKRQDTKEICVCVCVRVCVRVRVHVRVNVCVCGSRKHYNHSVYVVFSRSLCERDATCYRNC